MKKSAVIIIAAVTSVIGFQSARGAEPLKVLLITGGCCHDYKAQKDILKQGIEARVNAKVTHAFTDSGATAPPVVILSNPKAYDVIIHDECAADVKDPAIVELVLRPHREGIPGVNLHCAMHCYRVGDPGKPQTPGTPGAMWFDYLGLQSSGHEAQLPITISVLDETNPITKSIVGWVTGREELYNNIQITTAKPLARGKQGAGDRPGRNESVVVWTNEYGPNKTRVFSTTIGHNNATVSDPKYLDMVANGLLWAAGKLGEDGKPLPGYEATK